jgi:hypothetical protein
MEVSGLKFRSGTAWVAKGHVVNGTSNLVPNFLFTSEDTSHHKAGRSKQFVLRSPRWVVV